jgi:hypothetical protein
MTEIKVCGRCKKEKPKTEFHKSNTRVDKLSNRCKVCEKIVKSKKKNDPYADLYRIF